MGVSYRFQCTTITCVLLYQPLYVLLYILIETSTYLYDFQRFITRYHGFFKERSILVFFKKVDSNA